MTPRSAALALPFLIVMVGMAWEVVAVGAPALHLPSWSEIVTSRISGRPSLAFMEGLVVGGLVLILLLHFGRLLPWWRP